MTASGIFRAATVAWGRSIGIINNQVVGLELTAEQYDRSASSIN